MTEAVKNNTLLKTQTDCSQTVSNISEFQPLLFSFIWYKYTCLHDVSWAVFKGWFCEWGRRVYNWPNFNLQPSARPTKCAFKWRKLCFNISRIFTAKLNVFREWWLNPSKYLGLRFLVQQGDVRGSGRAFPLLYIVTCPFLSRFYTERYNHKPTKIHNTQRNHQQQHIRRVQNCDSITILYSLFGLSWSFFLVLVKAKAWSLTRSFVTV